MSKPTAYPLRALQRQRAAATQVATGEVARALVDEQALEARLAEALALVATRQAAHALAEAAWRRLATTGVSAGALAAAATVASRARAAIGPAQASVAQARADLAAHARVTTNARAELAGRRAEATAVDRHRERWTDDARAARDRREE